MVDFSSPDFATIKSRIKEHLKDSDRYEKFKDFDFDGSNMSVLLDVLAYNTHHNALYLNYAISEMFLDTATQENSLVSHAKELNYLPNSAKSAYVDTEITITPSETGSFSITIPKRTQFVSNSQNRNVIFSNSETVTAFDTEGTGIYKAKVRLSEGRYITEILDNDNLVISNSNVDTDSISVFVEDEQYRVLTDIFGVSPTDKVCYLEPAFDAKYKVIFGRDKFGRQPLASENVRIVYRVSSGSSANGITSLKPMGSIGGVPMGNIQVNLLQKCTIGGSERETIESIKFNAPRAIQAQERAVTKSDYAAILRKRFPNIQAISVYNGAEANPPQHGRVVISVDVFNGEGITSTEISAMREYLQTRSPLSIEPVFVSAKFLYIDLSVRIRYDRSVGLLSEGDIREKVSTAIQDFSDTNLNSFETRLSTSKLAKSVDEQDIGIISTQINPRAIIEYLPSLGQIESPSFDFGAKIRQGYSLDENNGFENYTPSVTSSRFTINGKRVVLIDDGKGILHAKSVETGTPKLTNRNLGKVDYQTGQVQLRQFKTAALEQFDGNRIKLYATMDDYSIQSKRDRIIAIRPDDVSIEVIFE